MYVCSKCGKEMPKLFDIVSEEGIVHICEECVQDEGVPVVKKPAEGAFEDPNNKKSVYERLSSAAGIDSDRFQKFGENAEEDSQDFELKEIVSKNLGTGYVSNLDVEVDLIRNFHWVVMRARRLKKLTLGELARKIAEPEDILKMIEKGDVSKSNIELIKKLELFFGIQVLTNEARSKINTVSNKQVSFDKVISQSLTIDDLREMKKEREEKMFGSKDEEDLEDAPQAYPDKSSSKISIGGKEKMGEEIEVKLETKELLEEDLPKDLTDEDINDIIFGRK